MSSSTTTQLSLSLLEILSLSNAVNNSIELLIIENIIQSSRIERDIKAIAFFGSFRESETYIAAASGIPKVVISNAIHTKDLHFQQNDQFNKNIFFVFRITVGRNTMWQTFFNAFLGIESSVRGIFIFRGLNPLHLEAHFKWCWINGFVNVLALVERKKHQFDLYTYLPFPVIRAIKVPVWQSETYFPNKLNNLHGYRMRTPIQFDPPRVFQTPDGLKGYAAEMFLEFMRQHNGKLQEVIINNSTRYDILSIMKEMEKGNIDISMHPFISLKRLRLSYPIRMIKSCIVVPFHGEIQAYEYFLRPFDSTVWYCGIAGLFYLTALNALSERFLSLGHSKWDFGKSFLLALQLMFYIPISVRKRRRFFNLHYATCYTQAAVLGFILSNLYSASLTSLLTKLVFNQQLNYLEEIIAKNLSIHAIDYEIPFILNKRGFPEGFSDLLVPREATDFMLDFVKFNADVAYAPREDLINFVLSQQQHLVRPVFHLAECLTTLPVGFMMPPYSQFEVMLNRFILQAASSGLIDKWIADAQSDGVRAGILKMYEDEQLTKRALNIRHFQFAWIVLGGGISLSILVFWLEILSMLRINILRIVYHHQIKFTN